MIARVAGSEFGMAVLSRSVTSLGSSVLRLNRPTFRSTKSGFILTNDTWLITLKSTLSLYWVRKSWFVNPGLEFNYCVKNHVVICSFTFTIFVGTSSPSTPDARLLSSIAPPDKRGPILRRVVKMKLYKDASCEHAFDLEDLAITMLVNTRCMKNFWFWVF